MSRSEGGPNGKSASMDLLKIVQDSAGPCGGAASVATFQWESRRASPSSTASLTASSSVGITCNSAVAGGNARSEFLNMESTWRSSRWLMIEPSILRCASAAFSSSCRALLARARALDACPDAFVEVPWAMSAIAIAFPDCFIADPESARAFLARSLASLALSPRETIASPDKALVWMRDSSPAPIPIVSTIKERRPSACFCSSVQPAGHFEYSAIYSPKHPNATSASETYSEISQNDSSVTVSSR